MNLRAPLAAALLPLALAAGIAHVPDTADAAAGSAGSSSAFTVDARVAASLVPTAPRRGRAWIEGTVVDRAGRHLDGVDVEAYDVDDLQGDPVASWQTYEDPEAGPEHGWYRMWGLRPGTYQLRFSTDSLPRRARYRVRWSAPVTVGSRDVVDLDETAITLVRKVDARLTAAFGDATLRPGEQAHLRLGLASPDVRPIVGAVRVQVDHQRPRVVRLDEGDRGRVTVPLPRQALGQHRVAVTFLGNDAVAASADPVVVRLRVTRNGR